MFAMIICMMLNSMNANCDVDVSRSDLAVMQEWMNANDFNNSTVVDVDKIDGGIQFKLHPNVFSDDSYVCVEYDASSDEYSIVEMKTNVDFVM